MFTHSTNTSNKKVERKKLDSIKLLNSTLSLLVTLCRIKKQETTQLIESLLSSVTISHKWKYQEELFIKSNISCWTTRSRKLLNTLKKNQQILFGREFTSSNIFFNVFKTNMWKCLWLMRLDLGFKHFFSW